jgi:hypothetical protein
MATPPGWTSPFAQPAPQYSPSNPAPYGKGAGILKVENGGGVLPWLKPVVIAPNGDRTINTSQADTGDGGGGGDGGAARAAAAARASARSASRQQNENASRLAQQQRGLIDAFASQRDVKLGNITNAFQASDSLLLKNYQTALEGLMGTKRQNEMAEADASFSNVANAVRERQGVSEQAASQGAGETDLLRAQLQALRNYSSNQGEVNRSFHDTLQSINNSVGSLNSDTASSRTNLFNQAEADREQAWANYANQAADAWTQIMNIEAGGNVESDTTEGYSKLYADAGDQAAAVTRNTYNRQGIPTGWTDWEGKGQKEERQLTSSNRAAAVNLGGAQKKPEGATLRKWGAE